MDKKKRAFIHTFGCQMNEYDSMRYGEVLQHHGYDIVDEPKRADLILLNSCSIREKAEQKLLSALGRYVIYHKNKPEMKIVLAGCTAQLRGLEIMKRFTELDMVMGTDNTWRLDEWLRNPISGARYLNRTPVEEYSFCSAAPGGGGVGVSANVTIMKGCDNRCAYCVVPAARGPRIDRPRGSIIQEVDKMVSAGAREIVLLGQNVNAYRRGPEGFAGLLRSVAERPGVLRVRFTTSHPRDLDLQTVKAVGETPEICSHFHLPVQSGSTRVMRRMGRGYTREDYLTRVGWIRENVPGAAVSTDIIVGFPGETEDDFDETMSLLDHVKYTFIYSFCYSDRPDTRAEEMVDRVDPVVASSRLARLQGRQEEISTENLRSWVGKEGDVLVEGPSRQGNGQMMGRLPTFEIVNFTSKGSEELTGEVVRVEITAAGHHTLEGRLV